MARSVLEFEDVTFYYPAAANPVFEGLSVRFPPGWTGVIGANGSGKTTLLHLACGLLSATVGDIRRPTGLIYCPQRTDDPPERLDEFVGATDRAACVLRGRLGVDADWAGRWDTLSHGERKRAQIAVALWRRPRVLAIDEPTNHIDLPARALLGEALRAFRGTGLLVSHDRALLDGLCTQTLFVEPPAAVIRPGGYTKAVELAEAEAAEARRAREVAKRDLARLQREAVIREQEAARSHRKRSKRGLPIKDHDARAKIGLARITGKDGQAGRVLRQMDGRLKQAAERLDTIRIRKDRRLGIDMQAARSRRDFLFRVAAGTLPLGEGRELRFGDLAMAPDDRVALTGPNGGGKSTLVRHILEQVDLPSGKLVYLPQEIDVAEGARLLGRVRRLGPDRLGEVMTVVSCLGTGPERLLQSERPSPGEVRKILLALGVTRRPHLIVMDEPTNHLDLPSIECLEAALGEVPCALLLVSHDLRFLQNLTRTRWEIAACGEGAALAQMRLEIRNGPV